jgi:hypothetical protein
MTALAAVALVVGGCADSRMAANNTASSQAETPHATVYGISSEGTTTDLYTEIFGKRDDKNAAPPATAATGQVQPATAVAATQPVQPSTAPAGTRQAKPATATAANRQVQPAPVATQVAQQPAPPQAPPEPDLPAGYGLTTNGPTTDLYTELFGPKRRDGQ